MASNLFPNGMQQLPGQRRQACAAAGDDRGRGGFSGSL